MNFPLTCVFAHTHIMQRVAMNGCAERYRFKMILLSYFLRDAAQATQRWPRRDGCAKRHSRRSICERPQDDFSDLFVVSDGSSGLASCLADVGVSPAVGRSSGRGVGSGGRGLFGGLLAFCLRAPCLPDGSSVSGADCVVVVVVVVVVLVGRGLLTTVTVSMGSSAFPVSISMECPSPKEPCSRKCLVIMALSSRGSDGGSFEKSSSLGCSGIVIFTFGRSCSVLPFSSLPAF
jgi:hypothetical protein